MIFLPKRRYLCHHFRLVVQINWTLLGEKIKEAASVYPDRDFGRKQNEYLHELMEKAERRKKELEAENVQALIYREEPFIYDCDSISFQVYLMIVGKGVWKQKIMVEKM